jgi:hypothetical protein
MNPSTLRQAQHRASGIEYLGNSQPKLHLQKGKKRNLQNSPTYCSQMTYPFPTPASDPLFSTKSRKSALLMGGGVISKRYEKTKHGFYFALLPFYFVFSVPSVLSVAKNTHLLCGYTFNQK